MTEEQTAQLAPNGLNYENFLKELDAAYASQQPGQAPELVEGAGDTPDIPANNTNTGSSGWLPKSFRTVNKAFRTATFGSPIVGSLATAALAGLAGYHLGPSIDRLLSPIFGRRSRRVSEREERRRRKTWGWSAAALAGLAFLATQFSTKRKGYGLLSYAPMGQPNVRTAALPAAPPSALRKNSSGWEPSLTIGESAQLIMNNPTLDPYIKEQSLSLLHSFDAPVNTPITGGTLVGQAIGTGRSAMAGAAIGFLTANVLGLPNPSSTAILGAVQNTLGTGPALATSVIFGH